jgi:hypothetical protein
MLVFIISVNTGVRRREKTQGRKERKKGESL